MKRVIRGLTVVVLVMALPAIMRGGITMQITDLGGGKVIVLATNISGNIRGYCVFESSSDLVTWRPVVTNLVNKTWSTNTFLTTNSVTFYRASVY